jgi:hypothetical protein
MIVSLPNTLAPLSQRITAWVGSGNDVRGARRSPDGVGGSGISSVLSISAYENKWQVTEGCVGRGRNSRAGRAGARVLREWLIVQKDLCSEALRSEALRGPRVSQISPFGT